MNRSTSRTTAEAILKGLAKHQLEMVHQQLLTTTAHQAIVSTVASFTSGIDPIARAQQWSSFVSAFEVVRDLDGGFYDTAAVLAYAESDGPDPISPIERANVYVAAGDDMSEALDRLFAGHRLVLVGAS